MENENDDMFFQQGFGIGPFQMINEIGEGKFGKVFLGIHEKTKEKVAIKQIPKEGEQNIQTVYDEINIQKKLFHPYLCKMYSVIESKYYLFIVTEYCGGGELFKKLNEEIDYFEEAQACKIFSQILSGLEYMHNNYIAHCDIKLENMLFDEYGDAKLTDFGLSKSFEGNINFTKTGGSPLYAAPEVFKGIEFKGASADIWSMGICLYLMVCGDFPFQGEDAKDLVRAILRNSFEVKDYVSPLFKDLIYKILEKNPNNRLTIQQIKEHPWMHIIDFNFMKSPGVSIKTDILPLDSDVIEEMVGTNESQIEKIISDILMNKHNNNTILYYLKIEIKIRNNEISVSDIRPTSQKFLEYINDEKSKLSYYGNDLNKKIKEIKKIILDKLKKKQSKIRENIKNSFQIDSPKGKDTPSKNNINKDKNSNNNNHINNPGSKKKINKNLSKLRSKTFGKFDFLEFIKQEQEKEKKRKEEEEKKKKMEEEKMKEKNKEIPKINKFEILKHYIGPLLFVHDIIDNIITKVVKTSVLKDPKLKFIPVNNSTLNVFATKPSLTKIDDTEGNETNSNTIVSSPKINKFRKFTDFTINTIEEFEFTSTTTKNTEKTFSFGFYNPKNKNKKTVKNVKTLTIDENDGKTNRSKDIKKLNGVSKNKNLNETDNKNNYNSKPKKFEKKKLLTHLQRNKSDNLYNILNNQFVKGIKENKQKKEKEENKKKEDNKVKKENKEKNKKNKSEEKKIINKIKDEEINKDIGKRKRRNSEKLRKVMNIEETEKKEEKVMKKKNEKKFINDADDKGKKTLFSNRIKRKSKLDENLNINNILSEKTNMNKTKNKGKNSSLSKVKEERKFSKTHKNMNFSQVNFYNKKKISNNLNSNSKKNSITSETIENSPLAKRKTSNRTLLIRRNKNRTDRIKTNINENDKQNSDKKTHMKTETVKIGDASNKKGSIKSTIFQRSSQKVISQSGRNTNNNKNLTKKNTDDSIVKRKINFSDKEKDNKDKEKKNIEFKTVKGNYSIDKRNLTKKIGIKLNGNKKDINNNNNKDESNQELNEIITKKNENAIKKIIGDNIGNNNITISTLKEQTRFSCKIFIDKKKLLFNLKLISNGKNRSVINGELEYGDKKAFEKLFSSLKEKLE